MDTAQVVNVEEQEKKHIESIAQEVGYALDKKTGFLEVQPALEQHPLTEEVQKQAENFNDQKSGSDENKLAFLIPALRKTTRTTKAINFLGQKMNWLSKKTGGEVALK